MTTAQPARGRADAVVRAWRRFRRWRRSRPFWGGLLTLLAGLEIFATTQMSLDGLKFQMGPTGYLSWLIPTVLVACGLLLWFTPQQRMFYSVVGAVTAVFSLIAVNLGGFLLGVVLGIIGSALGFAWIPLRPVTPMSDAADEVVDERPYGSADEPGPMTDGTMDDLLTPVTDTSPDADNPTNPAGGVAWRPEHGAYGPAESASPLPESGEYVATAYQSSDFTPADAGPAHPGHADPGATRDASSADPRVGQAPPGAGEPLPRRSPRLFVLLILLTCSTAAVIAAHGVLPAAAAAPCQETSQAPQTTQPTASATATATPTPAATATATPTATATAMAIDGGTQVGALIDGAVDGLTSISTGDPVAAEAAATSEPTAAPTAGQPTPLPALSATGPSQPSPSGDVCQPTVTPSSTQQAGSPLGEGTAKPGQPRVAKTPSELTGSKVTMYGLSVDGVVELPTVDGTVKVLQFSMKKAVTDDFALRVPGRTGATLLIDSSALTIDGDVKFYATRFVGRLLGVEIILTPELPVPDDLPLTAPQIAFDDPEIQLAFVECNELTARPAMRESFT